MEGVGFHSSNRRGSYSAESGSERSVTLVKRDNRL